MTTHSKAIGYLLWIFGCMSAHRFYVDSPTPTLSRKGAGARGAAAVMPRPIYRYQQSAILFCDYVCLCYCPN